MFEQRARGCELLDVPDGDPHLARQSYRFMERVNRSGGGIRAILGALSREVRSVPRMTPLHVLDLGAGSCDIPFAVVRWARMQHRDIRITCVDHKSEALERAGARWQGFDDGSVTLERADIFDFQPSTTFDYALASMVLHHFSAGEISVLMTHLRRFVRRALIVNDLHRSLLNYLACRVAVLPCEQGVRHDALLSVRRGFRRDELRAILREHDPAATVRLAWFCRVVGIVRFDREAGR